MSPPLKVLSTLLFTTLQPACDAEPAVAGPTGTLQLATVGWSPERGALRLHASFSVRGLSNGLSRVVAIDRATPSRSVDLELPVGLYAISMNEASELVSTATGKRWSAANPIPVPIAGVRAGSRTSVTLRIVEPALPANHRFDSLPIW